MSLVRACSHFIRDSLRAVPPKNVLPYLEHSYSWSTCGNPVRFYSNEVDPCTSPDVYKISPLCPPRGYEFKKSTANLKCKKEAPCKVGAKEKPKDSPKDPVKTPGDADCLKKPEKKESPKEDIKCKKEDKKASSNKDKKESSNKDKKASSNKEKKKSFFEKCFPKEEKKDDKPDCPKIGKKKESKKEDCPKKAEKSEEAPKKVENLKCADPPGPPDCGKPKEKCNVEKRKSVIPPIKPKKENIRPPVAPECASKESIPVVVKTNPACDIKIARAKALDPPKSDTDECPCSVRPWPFNLFTKCKKKSDEKCSTKSKKKPDKKCAGKCIQKMVAVPYQNLFPFENSLNYLRRKFIKSRLIHSYGNLNEPQPVCPKTPCPPCKKNPTISKQTEQIMIRLRATVRANNKRLPETCMIEKPTICMVPSEGLEPPHVFSLMRQPDVIKQSGGIKVIESPRLVSRKLRRRQ